MKILLATANPAKIKDFRLLLSDLSIELITPQELGITESPKETGKTFEENARLKAEWYMKKSGLPALADDGGFEIDVLDGAPGVYSRRWPLLKMGEDREATDEELITYTLDALKDVPKEKRSAQLRVVIALAMSNGNIITGKGVLRGIVTNTISKTVLTGFPFRSIFMIPEMNKHYSEFTKEEYKRYNQRTKAFEPIKVFLQTIL